MPEGSRAARQRAGPAATGLTQGPCRQHTAPRSRMRHRPPAATGTCTGRGSAGRHPTPAPARRRPRAARAAARRSAPIQVGETAANRGGALVADLVGGVGRGDAMRPAGGAAIASKQEMHRQPPRVRAASLPGRSASVVLPAPPNVSCCRTQITGTGARQPGCVTRRAVTAVVMAASGDSSRGTRRRDARNPVHGHQPSGSRAAAARRGRSPWRAPRGHGLPDRLTPRRIAQQRSTQCGDSTASAPTERPPAVRASRCGRQSCRYAVRPRWRSRGVRFQAIRPPPGGAGCGRRRHAASRYHRP